MMSSDAGLAPAQVQRVSLEVCVDTPAGLYAAVAAGADRIELCSALALAGLTPSLGLIQAAAPLPCPIYAMIRPRGGDFVYSDRECDIMRRDIDASRQAGLAGVVIGASRSDGALDEDVLALLLDHAEGLGVTLHRAFDLAPNKSEALETAIRLGFERVLTSGGAPTALEGAPQIRALVRQAGQRISIMAGSGVTAKNAPDLLSLTGVCELHASCSAEIEESGSTFSALFGAGALAKRQTQPYLVSGLVDVLLSLRPDAPVALT